MPQLDNLDRLAYYDQLSVYAMHLALLTMRHSPMFSADGRRTHAT